MMKLIRKLVFSLLVCILMASGQPLYAGQLGDIMIPRKNKANLKFMPRAVFPHWKHRTRFKCFVCHDKIFKMQLGADDINMTAISDGKFCAICHNGKTAFVVGFDTCERCHYAPRTAP